MAINPAIPPRAVMMGIVSGYWKSQAVYVAARLGLADLLKDGPLSAAQLAERTGTHAPSLYRLLRALASDGIFAEDAQGRFALTPLGQCLRTDVPDSIHAMAVMSCEEHYRAWGELLYSVQTGKTAFDHVFGKPIFDYLAEHPREGQIFDNAMVSVHGGETPATLEAYDFGGIRTLVDIGGGNGSLLTATLQRYPALRGILYDRAHVVERARPLLERAGVANRCTVMAGDFFQSAPPGGDAYLMRHIIHDWDDERCRTILRHVRSVIPAGGRLLVVESVIPPGNAPSFAKYLDLTMLVVPGGKERTEAEYRELFLASGFRLARIVPTRAEVSVIEGAPA